MPGNDDLMTQIMHSTGVDAYAVDPKNTRRHGAKHTRPSLCIILYPENRFHSFSVLALTR